MSNVDRVSAADFVAAYLNNHCDVKATADFLGQDRSGVRERVKRYRKAGIKLPVHRKNGNSLDVEGLNKLIKNLRG